MKSEVKYHFSIYINGTYGAYTYNIDNITIILKLWEYLQSPGETLGGRQDGRGSIQVS